MALTPLSVNFVGANEETPRPVKGRLYFVESEKTIYKDEVHKFPFSGINRVTFVTEGNITEIRFNDDYGTDGNCGKIVVGNESLVEYVNSIDTRLTTAEGKISTIDLTNASVINLDKVAPKPTGQHWTLSEGIAYVAGLSIDKNSVGLMFNNGTTTKIYFYTDPDLTQINDVSKWRDVQVGSGIEVITYGNRLSFPAVGTSDVLYMVSSDEEAWFWDSSTSTYKKVGVNIDNIKLIDSNFDEDYNN